jgi:hypothetical protein
MAGFLLDGRIAVRFCTTLTPSTTAPTQASLVAGVDLVGTKQTEELIEINGWEIQTSSIPTPGYAGVETGSLSGESQYPASSLAWRKDATSTTIYVSQIAGAAGFVVIAQDGLGSTKEAEVFPVTVASRERRKARNVPNSFVANYSLAPKVIAVQAA